jgi:hypothetical protein
MPEPSGAVDRQALEELQAAVEQVLRPAAELGRVVKRGELAIARSPAARAPTCGRVPALEPVARVPVQ